MNTYVRKDPEAHKISLYVYPDEAHLVAESPGGEEVVLAYLGKDGALHLPEGAGISGIATDSSGRIKVDRSYRPINR